MSFNLFLNKKNTFPPKGFIEVTEEWWDDKSGLENGKLLINIDSIITVFRSTNDLGTPRTFIFLKDFDDAVCIKDTYEEVMTKINNSL